MIAIKITVTNYTIKHYGSYFVSFVIEIFYYIQHVCVCWLYLNTFSHAHDMYICFGQQNAFTFTA